MSDKIKQTVGIVGGNVVAVAAARQLVGSCTVVGFDPRGIDAPRIAGVEMHGSLAALGARAQVVLVAEPAALDSLSLGAALPKGATVVDLMPGDPAQSQSLAKALGELGIAFVDAPIHCERFERFPEEAAILCGGSTQALASVLPVLERLGAKVVVCGEVGSGQVARAIVGAVAVCNRLVTYEGAGMGFRNGLTVGDMGTVLERCSGANSATARVLPAIAQGNSSADVRLADAATELALCVQLARRVGAPALIATQAFNQVLGASRSAGPEATLDDLRSLVESGSGFSFSP
jgi:3-hydroxyisobutyrate dehydrogenase